VGLCVVGLADKCTVFCSAQLMGIAIGALLALAFVGIAIFFVHRRINQFSEYLGLDCGSGEGEEGVCVCVCVCVCIL
jgi:hypothetical protein